METTIDKLHIVETPAPMPAIEIDTDSSSDDYREIIEDCLSTYAKNHQDEIISIYGYFTPSVNFGKYTNSIFFIAAESQKLIKYLYTFLSQKGDFNIRYGEYIQPAKGILTYHIEEGNAWRLDDAITFSLLDAPDDESDTCTDEEDSDAEIGTKSKVLRKYKARDDAKVGSIKRTIENIFGLPHGSVALCGPDGNKLRADALIRTLRSRWGEE